MKTITINNLAESTTEEVFEYIRHHLLTQMQQSKNDKGICFYRNEQGLKCAAGCLIPDDMYYPDLEYRKWHSLVTQEFAPEDHMELIQEMQRIHDRYDPITWEMYLDKLEGELDTFDKYR